MAIISGATIITSLSLFHMTLGYFFLVSPESLADQALVFLIGSAMGLPHTNAFDQKSPALAFLAAVFFMTGFSDLVSLSLPEEVSQYYWGSQAPVRLFFFGTLSFYSYTFSFVSPLYASSHNYQAGWGEGLKNRMVFTWAFLEMITWFWAFVTLREERQALARRVQEKRAMDEDMM